MHFSTEDTGLDIQPGVVLVDLDVVDLSTLTVTDLREAMDEATAQEDAEAITADEILGDLDINPL